MSLGKEGRRSNEGKGGVGVGGAEGGKDRKKDDESE